MKSVRTLARLDTFSTEKFLMKYGFYSTKPLVSLVHCRHYFYERCLNRDVSYRAKIVWHCPDWHVSHFSNFYRSRDALYKSSLVTCPNVRNFDLTCLQLAPCPVFNNCLGNCPISHVGHGTKLVVKRVKWAMSHIVHISGHTCPFWHVPHSTKVLVTRVQLARWVSVQAFFG